MSLIKTQRPSPWMLVAVAALAFAMVGTAVAGTDAVSKLTKSKVRSIADKEIKKKAPGLTVAKAASADNATNAVNAANAAKVGGQTSTKLFTKIASGTGATTVFEGSGLRLTAACSAGGALTFAATTSVNDSILLSEGNNNGTAFGSRTSDFDVGNTETPLGGQARGAGSMTYSTPTGAFATITYAADDADTFGTFDGCVVVGTAMSG